MATAKKKTHLRSRIMTVYLFMFAAVTVYMPQAQARVDSIFSVPTVEPELAQAARFPSSSDQDVYGSPEKLGLLRFALPEELTGIQAEFELSRKADGRWDGIGTDGSKITGNCVRDNHRWFSCTVDFTGLVIDTAARDLILIERFGRGFEFEQRSAVARTFERQPIGIIKVRIGRG